MNEDNKEIAKTTGLTFGRAIEALKDGKKVARKGWNGKGMWIIHVKTENYEVYSGDIHLDKPYPDNLPWIGMKTSDNKFVPWLASQSDMLSEDWCILETT